MHSPPPLGGYYNPFMLIPEDSSEGGTDLCSPRPWKLTYFLSPFLLGALFLFSGSMDPPRRFCWITVFLKVVRTSSARSAERVKFKVLENPLIFLSAFKTGYIFLYLPWKYLYGDFGVGSTASKSRKTQVFHKLSAIWVACIFLSFPWWPPIFFSVFFCLYKVCLNLVFGYFSNLTEEKSI